MFLALVRLTAVRGTSVRKKDTKTKRAQAYPPLTFGHIFDHKSIKNRFKKSSRKRSPQNIKFDAKGVPKWSQNRCQKSSKINAKTGNEKDQENHQQSCFSEW